MKIYTQKVRFVQSLEVVCSQLQCLEVQALHRRWIGREKEKEKATIYKIDWHREAPSKTRTENESRIGGTAEE